MDFEPEKITLKHVLEAVQRIEEQHIPLKSSTGYDVVIDGKRWPPKEIMRYAHEQMNGLHDWWLSGGEPTNKFLRKLGFEILEKNTIPVKSIKELIKKYKIYIEQGKMQEERYKWDLIARFRGHPDPDVADFSQEVQHVDFSNLIYGIGIGAVRHLARDRAEAYRACCRGLFDEGKPLNERIKTFSGEIEKLYRELVPNPALSHHHDERTMATLLTYHDPERYVFFKDSFYQKYCRLLGIKAKEKNEKYVDYLALIDALVEDFIDGDKELLSLVRACIPAPGFDDRRLIAQDFLYRMLDLGKEEIDLAGAGVYKISMGKEHFSDADIEFCIDEQLVIVHEETRAKGRSQESQGEIFKRMRIGDYFYLTHSNNIKLLGQISGEPVWASLRDLGDDGWLERSFEWVNETINNQPYTNTKRWWTPNDNSTVAPVNDLDEGNRNLFIPYFNIEFVNNVQPTPVGSISVETRSELILESPVNKILYGPPGTGKTFNTIREAVCVANPSFAITGDRETLKAEYDRLIKAGQIIFTTFHQSMSYEDFVEGIKPETTDAGTVVYQVRSGIFKTLCTTALTPNVSSFDQAYEQLTRDLAALGDEGVLELMTPKGKPFGISLNSRGNLNLHTGPEKTKNGVLTREGIQRQLVHKDWFKYWLGYFDAALKLLKDKYAYSEQATSGHYVLIIDEINRGNVSQIFGELITLIEPDKRLGMPEAITVTLPYSKEIFGVPANVHIIGTMNTADRSVEALDSALRRRFTFEEVRPEPSLLYAQEEKTALPLSSLLSTLNARIEKLLDRDHQIGHSYFLAVQSWSDLEAVFRKNIVPLLQEYFFGDYGKIRLVLGEGFCREKKAQGVTFAVKDAEYEDYTGRKVYELFPDGFNIQTAVQSLQG